jgi:hypothetical protein
MRHLFYILSALFLFGCGSDTDGLTDSKACNLIAIENQSNYELTIETKLSNFTSLQTIKLKTSESQTIGEDCYLDTSPPALATSINSLTISTIINDQSMVVYSGLKADDWIKTRESKLLNSYKLTLTDLNLTISQ